MLSSIARQWACYRQHGHFVKRERSLSSLRSLVGTVVIVSPGGLDNGGGIGRQMGYFLQERQRQEAGLAYRVSDSRGPWFLDASPFRAGFASIYLGSAILKLLTARVCRMPCLLHVNITGRGSTVRKTILLIFARFFGLRYLLHVHDYDYANEYHRRGRFMKSAITNTFRRAAKVIVLGTRDRDLLSELLCLPEQQVAVLYNAVPDPLPDLQGKRRPGNSCHILFLGHLSARKGVPELLRALATPTLMSRRWRATLAGGGPIDEFRRLADDLGITERLDFPGWINESRVRVLCGNADVLVLPSHAEGLAMAVLEGLSHGMVVVTTPVGAHSEVIEPEISGILIPAGDVQALAVALARVIDDESLRQRLGEGARRRFLEKFDVRAYGERLSQLHASLLSDCSRCRSQLEKSRPLNDPARN
jgi:glycosyltransferase involved in cell wall biosynthesis